jgi:hypothetical protein
MHEEAKMKKENTKVKHEIQVARELLYNCLEKDGICEDPTLISVNNRLDELILQWMKSSK